MLLTAHPALHTETFGEGDHLALIHGWGAQNTVWREWAKLHLAPHFCVTLIELPGFGDSAALPNSDDIETAWLNAILEVLPPHTHLLGWSLGGLLAQKIAVRAPTQITSLICLASTPKFVQTEGWNWAVSPTLLGDFIQAIGQDTLATLKHFWKLQIQGSDGARLLIKEFSLRMTHSKIPQMDGLIQGLQLLKAMDCRQDAATLTCPVLWLLGENDPLIPQDFITQFSTIQPTAQVEILTGAAHMPFLSHPRDTAAHIIAFLKTVKTVNRI